MDSGAHDQSPQPDNVTLGAIPWTRFAAIGAFVLSAVVLMFVVLGSASPTAFNSAIIVTLAALALGISGALVWPLVVPGYRLSADGLARGSAQRAADQKAVDAARQDPLFEGRAGSMAMMSVPQMARMPGDEVQNFIDQSPVGLAALDASGRVMTVNAMLAGWLGTSVADMTSTKFQSFIDVSQNGGSGGISAGDVELKSLDGHTFPAHISRNDIAIAQGGGMRIAVRQLSGERELEETLRRAEEGFRRFFDYAPVGIVIVDGGGAAVETNPAFQAITNTGDDPGAVSFLELFDEADRDEVARRLDAARAGPPDEVPLEVRVAGPDERTVQIYARRTGLGENNNVPDLIVYIVDTTDLKNLEAQVAQSQKMQAVGQLAGGIAHDFNNLLTAMIGFSDLLLQRYSPGDQSFGDIMQIKQNANRAANLVRQLLAFSRRQTLQPKVLNLTDVLAELSHLLRRLIGENIELEIIHARDIGLIRVDQGQLEQVVINLAVNARDAMPEGGTLTIRSGNASFVEPTRMQHEVVPAGDFVVIEVSDTGDGISAGDLDKIFEPFFTTKDVGAGTGLGLSTVYGIIKQTGGFTIVESPPGQGATFRIYLPQHTAEERAAEIAAAEAAAKPLPADLTGKDTILLVEDEDPVRLFATRALENKGYKVLQADCAEMAMEVVEDFAGEIDLVITDVVMPQMDGPTFIRWLVERRGDIKVIYISGYAEDVFRKTITGDRPYDFLPKPFSLKDLAIKVKNVMEA